MTARRKKRATAPGSPASTSSCRGPITTRRSSAPPTPRTKLAAAGKQAREQEIEAEITKALEAGKITPATADYHRAQCKAEGGLERFKEYVEAAPEVARNTNLGGTPPGKGAALTGDAAKIAAMFGHTAEDLKEYR